MERPSRVYQPHIGGEWDKERHGPEHFPVLIPGSPGVS